MVRSLKHKGGKTMKRRVSKGGAKKSKKHVGKKSRKHNKTKRSTKKGGGFFSTKKEIPKSMIYQGKVKEIFGKYLHTRDEEDNVTSRIIIGVDYHENAFGDTHNQYIIYTLTETLYNLFKEKFNSDIKYYIDGNKLYTKSNNKYTVLEDKSVLKIKALKGENYLFTFDRPSFDSKYKKHLISDGPYNNKIFGIF